MDPGSAKTDTANLTLVVAEDCSLCDHGRKVLRALAADLPIEVREVRMESEEGLRLGARVPLVFPPVLLLGDDVIAYGRLSERRLRKELGRAVAAAPAATAVGEGGDG